MGGGSCMKVSYCRELLNLQTRHDLCILSVLCDSPRNSHYACVIKSMRERQLTPAYIQEIRRYNNSALYLTSRWPLQQTPLLIFLGSYKEKSVHKISLCTNGKSQVPSL